MIVDSFGGESMGLGLRITIVGDLGKFDLERTIVQIYGVYGDDE